MRELQPDNADLRRLNEQYVRQAGCQNWGTLPFYEMYPTGGTILVDQNSADPKVPNQESYNPVPKDHINIAKCNSKDELVYRQIFQFVKKFTQLSIVNKSMPLREYQQQINELSPLRTTQPLVSIQLTPEQRVSFREAILSAYPKQAHLDVVLDLIDIKLLDVVAQDGYIIMINNFIAYCQSQGRINEVLEIMYKDNSGNRLLKEFYNSIK